MQKSYRKDKPSREIKKRILLLASNTRSLLNFRRELMQAWLQAGFEVIAVAPHTDSEALYALQQLGVKFIWLPFSNVGLNPFSDARLLLKFYRLMCSVKPDKVFAYTIKPVIYGLLAARFARIKQRYAMITGTGSIFDEPISFVRRRILSGVIRLYRMALKNACCVFFQNEDDSHVFLTKKMVKLAQVVHIAGSGVNLDHYQKTPVPEVASFLMIARLVRAKGVYEYAAAAAELRESFPEAQCHLVGPLVPEHPDAVAVCDLERWVQEGVLHYHGEQQDVRPFIASASVYVLPSYREGTPRSVLEAMAMGRAVITTDAPGCRNTVKPGVTGHLVPIKNVEALVLAMKTFMIAPLSASKLGEAGYHYAQAQYDVHSVNRCILQRMEIEPEVKET